MRSTARGFSTGLVTVGPTEAKDHKSVLFTESTPEFEKKNTGLIQLTHYIFPNQPAIGCQQAFRSITLLLLDPSFLGFSFL